MAAGKPVLGVLESGSEACRLIQESGCGVVVEPQQYEEVIQSMKRLYNLDRGRLVEYGLHGRAYLDRHLRRELSLDRYRKLLLSLKMS
ncbi:hypothetical protein D3C73_1339170 [compost metagenome]